MNDELISRNALIKALKDSGIPCHANINGIIMTAPTVEARAKGKWNQPARYTLSCLECGFEIEAENISNFCPNCGADMRGDD